MTGAFRTRARKALRPSSPEPSRRSSPSWRAAPATFRGSQSTSKACRTRIADLYSVIRSLGAGETLTYGEIAKRLGGTWTARDVGAAMGRNPVPVIVPCHRVVAANGKLGGFSAPGGNTTKRRMLAIEEAVPKGHTDLFGSAGSPNPASQ